MIVIEACELDRKKLLEVGTRPLEPDTTDYAGRVVEKPWGREWESHRDDACSIWTLQISAGCETSMHCHPNKATVLIVNAGRVRIETLQRCEVFGPGSVILLGKGVFHRTVAGDDAMVTEIEMPPNKRDLVRIADRYGREGQPYEEAT